jgi:hypothetical protein
VKSLDGYWLPAALRDRLMTPHTRWQEARFARGRECGTECDAGVAEAVTARWPSFDDARWEELLSGLRAARDAAPAGPAYWERLRAAAAVAARRLSDPDDSSRATLLRGLSGYTGYSEGMIAAALMAPGLWDLEALVSALRFQPSKVSGARWREIPGLRGRVRFFPSRPIDQAAGWLPVAWEMPLYRTDTRPGFVLGYAAGNVPGHALMMIILALSATLRGEAPLPRPVPPPVTVICGSRREPLLAPAVLSLLEDVDPELVSMVAVMGWDTDDEVLRKRLYAQADVVVGTAGDDDNRQLAREVARVPGDHRFHAHGHKVGFTAISRETLQLQYIGDEIGWSPPGGTEIIDIVALLAALDSAFWDQNSCISSRVHFLEQGSPADDLPAEYARRLTYRLRQIATVVPRGSWPVRLLHDAYDRYKSIEGTDRWGTGLRVISDYDDPFVVILDERTSQEFRMDPRVFASIVNECHSRVIMVRPVDDIMDVPWRYLKMLPRRSLQSVSLAAGLPGQGLTRQILDFAGACASCGVTSIRLAGAGPFPSLTHSWDGLLPLDFVGRRPSGYFSTIEFDSPFEQMIEIYQGHVRRFAKIPPVDKGGPVTPI